LRQPLNDIQPEGLRQANGTTEAAVAPDAKTTTNAGATSAIAANRPVSEVSFKNVRVKAFAGAVGYDKARLGSRIMRLGLYLATMLAASSLAAAETPLTIDKLLAEGWEIAGYASGYDNRTSLILFRHSGVNVLVQCGILYDVTRTPRTVVNCYELR
jgi:hypothetical protein